MHCIQPFLLSTLLVASVLAHPRVSNPHQIAIAEEQGPNDPDVLYPDQQPLHTTVLMAQATAAVVQ